MLHLLTLLAVTATPSPRPYRHPYPNRPCFASLNCNERPVACFAAGTSNGEAKTQHKGACPKVATVEPITVAIAADGSITAEGRAIPLQALHKYFQHVAATRPDTPLSVLPDVNTRYGTVLQVLDAAKAAGLHPTLSAPLPH